MTTTTNPASDQYIPALPIPEPIRSDVPGTWAHSTTTIRIADIARRTLFENEFAADIKRQVEALIAGIPLSPIRLLQQDAAPDAQMWADCTRPYVGQNWLETPWFFSETYFYRRLLEATGYFETGCGQELDPFIYQKEQGLSAARPVIAALAERLNVWFSHGFQGSHLAALLAIDLWGNRADMSLWPADEGDQPTHAEWETLGEHTLDDDTNQVIQHLEGNKPARVDFMIDNAGLELVADLTLTDYLLTTGAAASVHLHLKMHPTFVSDAMKKDVRHTINVLRATDEPAVAAFGQRLSRGLADGRLILHDHPFWTSPLALWEMPQDLRQDLSQSNLIISKGDANYRRLLGDRHWPYTTSFQDIMAYTPAPLLALRSLKAEVAAGIQQEQITRLNEEDPDWMVNGRWGVIQFARGRSGLVYR